MSPQNANAKPLQPVILEMNPAIPLDRVQCGNSLFTDDVWDMTGFDKNPLLPKYKNRFDFTPFNPWQSIKLAVKHYIKNELMHNSLTRTHNKFLYLIHFRTFLMDHPEIQSIDDVNTHALKAYFEYVFTLNSKKTGELLHGYPVKTIAQVVKELMELVQQKERFQILSPVRVERLYEEMVLNHERVKKVNVWGQKSNKTLPDDATVDHMIQTARTSLQQEVDIEASSAILICSQVGLRISELMELKADCIKTFDGKAHLVYTTRKTKKESKEVQVHANELVIEAVNALLKHSQDLRNQSGLPYLYLNRVTKSSRRGSIVPRDDSGNWSKQHLYPFFEKHNITDANGMKMTHHHLRHICATHAVRGGMRPEELKSLLNHSSLTMTLHYDHRADKQEAVSAILRGEVAVVSANKALVDAIEAKDNAFKGATIDEIESLRNSMKIELVPAGMCFHHPLRGEPCAQDNVCLGCKHFVATEFHLPTYRHRLNRVETELNSTSVSDQNIYTNKLRNLQSQLTNLIDSLEQKIQKNGGVPYAEH